MSFPTEQDLKDGLELHLDTDPEEQWGAVKQALKRGHTVRFTGRTEGVEYRGIIDRVLECPIVHVKLTEIEGKAITNDGY